MRAQKNLHNGRNKKTKHTRSRTIGHAIWIHIAVGIPSPLAILYTTRLTHAIDLCRTLSSSSASSSPFCIWSALRFRSSQRSHSASAPTISSHPGDMAFSFCVKRLRTTDRPAVQSAANRKHHHQNPITPNRKRIEIENEESHGPAAYNYKHTLCALRALWANGVRVVLIATQTDYMRCVY